MEPVLSDSMRHIRHRIEIKGLTGDSMRHSRDYQFPAKSFIFFVVADVAD
jgi:hypothetical protein